MLRNHAGCLPNSGGLGDLQAAPDLSASAIDCVFIQFYPAVKSGISLHQLCPGSVPLAMAPGRTTSTHFTGFNAAARSSPPSTSLTATPKTAPVAQRKLPQVQRPRRATTSCALRPRTRPALGLKAFKSRYIVACWEIASYEKERQVNKVS